MSSHQDRKPKDKWAADPVYHYQGPVSYIRADVVAQRIADAYRAGLRDRQGNIGIPISEAQ